MIRLLPAFGACIGSVMLLSGCLYGQCMNGPCALTHNRLVNSIKTYGEYWTKPGMTKESWRQDWVACGGMADGGYSAANASPAVDTTTLLALTHKKVEGIGTCMSSKGYEYHNEP